MGVVLRSDGAAQRLDEGALYEGKGVGKQERAGIHVDLGQPQVLGKTPGIEVSLPH